MAKIMTARRRKFCELYLQNQTTDGAVKAYREAYRNKGSFETTKRDAMRLLKDEKIREYIDGIRKETARRMGITLEQHLLRLEELGRKAEESGQYSAAISAETQRGKASGLYVEQKKIDGNLTIVWGGDEDNQDSV